MEISRPSSTQGSLTMLRGGTAFAPVVPVPPAPPPPRDGLRLPPRGLVRDPREKALQQAVIENARVRARHRASNIFTVNSASGGLSPSQMSLSPRNSPRDSGAFDRAGHPLQARSIPAFHKAAFPACDSPPLPGEYDGTTGMLQILGLDGDYLRSIAQVSIPCFEEMAGFAETLIEKVCRHDSEPLSRIAESGEDADGAQPPASPRLSTTQRELRAKRFNRTAARVQLAARTAVTAGRRHSGLPRTKGNNPDPLPRTSDMIVPKTATWVAGSWTGTVAAREAGNLTVASELAGSGLVHGVSGVGLLALIPTVVDCLAQLDTALSGPAREAAAERLMRDNLDGARRCFKCLLHGKRAWDADVAALFNFLEAASNIPRFGEKAKYLADRTLRGNVRDGLLQSLSALHGTTGHIIAIAGGASPGAIILLPLSICSSWADISQSKLDRDFCLGQAAKAARLIEACGSMRTTWDLPEHGWSESHSGEDNLLALAVTAVESQQVRLERRNKREARLTRAMQFKGAMTTPTATGAALVAGLVLGSVIVSSAATAGGVAGAVLLIGPLVYLGASTYRHAKRGAAASTEKWRRRAADIAIQTHSPDALEALIRSGTVLQLIVGRGDYVGTASPMEHGFAGSKEILLDVGANEYIGLHVLALQLRDMLAAAPGTPPARKLLYSRLVFLLLVCEVPPLMLHLILQIAKAGLDTGADVVPFLKTHLAPYLGLQFDPADTPHVSVMLSAFLARWNEAKAMECAMDNDVPVDTEANEADGDPRFARIYADMSRHMDMALFAQKIRTLEPHVVRLLATTGNVSDLPLDALAFVRYIDRKRLLPLSSTGLPHRDDADLVDLEQVSVT